MTSRSYFDKMNSTLGSVVPMAIFLFVVLVLRFIVKLWINAQIAGDSTYLLKFSVLMVLLVKCCLTMINDQWLSCSLCC